MNLKLIAVFVAGLIVGFSIAFTGYMAVIAVSIDRQHHVVWKGG